MEIFQLPLYANFALFLILEIWHIVPMCGTARSNIVNNTFRQTTDTVKEKRKKYQSKKKLEKIGNPPQSGQLPTNRRAICSLRMKCLCPQAPNRQRNRMLLVIHKAGNANQANKSCEPNPPHFTNTRNNNLRWTPSLRSFWIRLSSL